MGSLQRTKECLYSSTRGDLNLAMKFEIAPVSCSLTITYNTTDVVQPFSQQTYRLNPILPCGGYVTSQTHYDPGNLWIFDNTLICPPSTDLRTTCCHYKEVSSSGRCRGHKPSTSSVCQFFSDGFRNPCYEYPILSQYSVRSIDIPR